MARIIVNADDFGLDAKTNFAIYQALQSNLISNTTLLANLDGFDDAVEMIQDRDQIINKIGLHINLTQGKPLTSEIAQNPKFCLNGNFHGKIRESPIFTLKKKDQIQVINEIAAQIHKVKKAGINVTHVDGHHHIHTELGIYLSLKELFKKEGIKSVRISRTNFKQSKGIKSVLKKFYKWFFNSIVRLHGFKTTSFMGEVEDFNAKNIQEGDVFEIMVHFTASKTGDFTIDGEHEKNLSLEKIIKTNELISFSQLN